MEDKRESLIFYRSFYEAIKELTLEQQWEIYNAIFTYWLDFIEPTLTWISKTVFTLIKPQLDANIKKYKNWKEPKHKQERSKSEAKPKQKWSKTQGNVNDNVNVNVNVNDNKQELEKVILHRNNVFKEKRQVTPDLLIAYKILRKKYSIDEFKIWFSQYCWDKHKTEKQFILSPLAFMKQSNWFANYM